MLENFPQTDLSTTINHFSQLPKLFYTWIQNELCFILAPKANDGTISFWRKWKIYEELFITLYIECDRLEKRCVFFCQKKEKNRKIKAYEIPDSLSYFLFISIQWSYYSIDFLAEIVDHVLRLTLILTTQKKTSIGLWRQFFETKTIWSFQNFHSFRTVKMYWNSRYSRFLWKLKLENTKYVPYNLWRNLMQFSLFG